MKYVFFGTADFSASVLKKLVAAGLKPDLVVSNPDKPVGRKQIITPPPVKVIAQENGIGVWQPEKLEAPGFKEEIKKSGGFDLAVIAAYGKIISQEVLDTLPGKFICVHPSLLPKFRGATPIQSAILTGEAKTGTTLFLMDAKMDHGPIIAQKELPENISEADCAELSAKLADLSADLLIQILPEFAKGKITPEVQDEALATVTRKFKPEDGFVDEDDLASAETGSDQEKVQAVDRKIRALNPEPGVYTIKEGKRIKLLKAKVEGGRLKLVEIQKEGKKPTRLF